MKKRLFSLITFTSLLIFTPGCDDIVSDNPIILESVHSIEYHVDTETDDFSQTQRIFLQAILEDIPGAEEVNLFNVTMKVKNLGETSPDTEVTAKLAVRRAGSETYHSFVDISNVALFRFENEQSVLTEDIAGVTPNPEGLKVVQQIFNESPLPVIDLAIEGSANTPDGSPQRVTFDFEITIYTQISTYN
jgi:hypothetical protein